MIVVDGQGAIIAGNEIGRSSLKPQMLCLHPRIMPAQCVVEGKRDIRIPRHVPSRRSRSQPGFEKYGDRIVDRPPVTYRAIVRMFWASIMWQAYVTYLLLSMIDGDPRRMGLGTLSLDHPSLCCLSPHHTGQSREPLTTSLSKPNPVVTNRPARRTRIIAPLLLTP